MAGASPGADPEPSLRDEQEPAVPGWGGPHPLGRQKPGRTENKGAKEHGHPRELPLVWAWGSGGRWASSEIGKGLGTRQVDTSRGGVCCPTRCSAGGGGAHWPVGVGGGGKGWFWDVRAVGPTMPQCICPRLRDVFVPSGWAVLSSGTASLLDAEPGAQVRRCTGARTG